MSYDPDLNYGQVSHCWGYNEFSTHARAFLHSAGVLVDDVISRKNYGDYAAPPAIYLMRHSLELFTKYLVHNQLEQHNLIEPKALVGHDFLKILDSHYEDLESSMDHEPDPYSWGHAKWLADYKAMCEKVSETDPDGQSIRYTMDIHEKPTQDGGYVVCFEELALIIKLIDELYMKYLLRDAGFVVNNHFVD